MMKRKTEVEKVFGFFGPQVCQDKVKGFLTPGYKVLRAEVDAYKQGKPSSITLHEYAEMEIDVEEFVRNFDNIDVKFEAEESGKGVISNVEGLAVIASTFFLMLLIIQ